MSRRSTKGKAEYQALADALTEITPHCHGDDRFTADDLTNPEVTNLKRICAGCEIRDLCAAYGAAARPPAGVWAGRTYRNTTREPKERNPR